MEINPRLVERTAENARRPGGPMPRSWLVSFAPPGYTLTMEDLTAPEWTPSIVDYANELRDIARSVIAALNEVGWTADNIAVAYATMRACIDEATIYNHPVLDRPGASMTGSFHWEQETSVMIATAVTHGIATPLDVLRGRMAVVGNEIAATHEILFGRRSVGWLSNMEKVRVLRSLNGMIDAAASDRIHALWTTHGGDAEEWPAAWAHFVDAVQLAIPRFDAVRAPEHSLSLGNDAINEYLRGLWINDTPVEVLALCRRHEASYRTELERLNHIIDRESAVGPTIPTSDEHLGSLAEEYARSYGMRFVTTGILPEAWDPRMVTRSVRPVGNQDTSVASSHESGTVITFMPFTGNEREWQVVYGAQLGMITAHELTHAGQARQNSLPRSLCSRMAVEGGATHMQWSWAILESNPHVTRAMVDADYRICRAMRVLLEYHLGMQTDEERIISEYCSDTGLGRKAGERMLQTTMLGPSYYGMYFFGALFVDRYVRERHAGDVLAALRTLAHTTGLVVTPHVLLGNVHPSTFRLEAPEVPMAVAISRGLHPPS